MTREEAQRLLQTYMASLELPGEGLNPQGLGGLMLEDAELYFEYSQQHQALKASALIYRFRQAPKPGLVEGFRHEESAGTDAGGGHVDYMPESKGLFLSRTYTQVPQQTLFQSDMKRLADASLVWSGEVADRVADKVFGNN